MGRVNPESTDDEIRALRSALDLKVPYFSLHMFVCFLVIPIFPYEVLVYMYYNWTQLVKQDW